MEAKNFLLKAGRSKRTNLDKAYNKHVICILETLDEEKENRWETYNLVIQQLMTQNKGEYFKEIKYRLTDGENPNQVILDIINRDLDSVNGLVWLLKRRIEEYIEEDFIRRFYI